MLPTSQLLGRASRAFKSFRELHGVVVSAGLMQKTVKVRIGSVKWNKFLKKFFTRAQTHMVHDPNDSLRTGDIVIITPGERNSRNKRHVVKRIVAAAGTPLWERPPVPTEEERWAAATARAEAKLKHRALRNKMKEVQESLDKSAFLVRKAMRQAGVVMRLGGPFIVKKEEAVDVDETK